jgi:NAD(P)H-hydrate repair Nnr-like enzyme with NAD(P)H-hydrate epimerase domain
MTVPESTLPTLISPRNRALPLLTLTDLRILETQAAAALPPHTLMSRAGKAAASYLQERITRDTSTEKSKHKVWVVAGPGNNGGDALIMAAELHQAGIAVDLCMPLEVKPDDARWALDTARAAEPLPRHRRLRWTATHGWWTACSASA